MVALTFLGSLAAMSVSTTATLLTTTNGQGALDVDLDNKINLDKRQGGYFPVVGVPDNQIRVRYPLQTLYDQFRDQFTLFILGFQDFQSINQSDPLSYYQIAGIHGLPNIPWNGVRGSGNGYGYCRHSSILFPTWHRAYMGLFEQQWKVSVDRVVQRFPAGARRRRYAAAAATIRFPYLDWANKPSNYQHVIPSFITDQTITIDTPNGVQSIFNPLFRYTFHPLNSNDMIFPPWKNWAVTLRNPNNQNWNAVSQNNLVTAAFDSPNIYNNLRQNLYNLFTLCTEFTEFSNNKAGSSTPRCYTSIEIIHDQIHNIFGGGNQGHMSNSGYSSFDPFFWLHHMNVERLFAMWQATNRDSYYDYAWKENISNYMVTAGQMSDVNTPLWPFTINTQGNFWTPNNIYNHRFFKSTFPEFINWDGTSASMRAIINRLYGTPAGSRTKRSIVDDVQTLGGSINGNLDSVLTNGTLAALTTPQGKLFEYIVNIATPRFALNGSYNVYCFLGEPTTNSFLTDSNLVGFVPAFAMPGMQGVMDNDLISGAVPLTNSLVNLVGAKKLASLKPRDVTPFLKKNFLWKVVSLDGHIFDNSKVPGLKVSVVHSNVMPAKSVDQFPTWSQFDPLSDVTNGKAGGVLPTTGNGVV